MNEKSDDIMISNEEQVLQQSPNIKIKDNSKFTEIDPKVPQQISNQPKEILIRKRNSNVHKLIQQSSDQGNPCQ